LSDNYPIFNLLSKVKLKKSKSQVYFRWLEDKNKKAPGADYRGLGKYIIVVILVTNTYNLAL